MDAGISEAMAKATVLGLNRGTECSQGEMGLILPQVVAVGAQTQKVAWTAVSQAGARDLRLYGQDV